MRDLRLLTAAVHRRELEQERAIVEAQWRDLPRGQSGNPKRILQRNILAARVAAVQIRLALVDKE